MSHLDEDVIAGIALGDVASEESQRHLDGCERCAQQLGELTNIVGLAESMDESVELETPPTSVWSSISREVGTQKRRGVNGWGIGLIAAASALFGGMAVGALSAQGGSDDAAVLASAELSDLTTNDVSGSAEIVERADGSRVLILDVDAYDPGSGFLEVWMIDTNVEGMLSLGALEGQHGEFVLPEGLSYSAFPVVDVSIEPFDGVPTHSGVSVTRGILES